MDGHFFAAPLLLLLFSSFFCGTSQPLGYSMAARCGRSSVVCTDRALRNPPRHSRWSISTISGTTYSLLPLPKRTPPRRRPRRLDRRQFGKVSGRPRTNAIRRCSQRRAVIFFGIELPDPCSGMPYLSITATATSANSRVVGKEGRVLGGAGERRVQE